MTHHLTVEHDVTNIGHDRTPLAKVATRTQETLAAEELNVVCDRGYRVLSFTTAFDKWLYDDGRIEANEIRGLRGNTERRTQKIRIRDSLSPENAAVTLFHDVAHVTSVEPDYLEQEIGVRVRTEHFAIRQGLPPTGPNYRRPDGTVNVPAIRRSVLGSSHYNPSGRTRIGRRYAGDADLGAWPTL